MREPGWVSGAPERTTGSGPRVGDKGGPLARRRDPQRGSRRRARRCLSAIFRVEGRWWRGCGAGVREPGQGERNARGWRGSGGQVQDERGRGAAERRARHGENLTTDDARDGAPRGAGRGKRGHAGFLSGAGAATGPIVHHRRVGVGPGGGGGSFSGDVSTRGMCPLLRGICRPPMCSVFHGDVFSAPVFGVGVSADRALAVWSAAGGRVGSDGGRLSRASAGLAGMLGGWALAGGSADSPRAGGGPTQGPLPPARLGQRYALCVHEHRRFGRLSAGVEDRASRAWRPKRDAFPYSRHQRSPGDLGCVKAGGPIIPKVHRCGQIERLDRISTLAET